MVTAGRQALQQARHAWPGAAWAESAPLARGRDWIGSGSGRDVLSSSAELDIASPAGSRLEPGQPGLPELPSSSLLRRLVTWLPTGHAGPAGAGCRPVETDCGPSQGLCSSSSSNSSSSPSWAHRRVGHAEGRQLPLQPPAALAALGPPARGHGSAPPYGICRSYHAWFYGSKLRNRSLGGVGSLEEVATVLRRDGDRLDHVNLSLLLHRLSLAAAEARESAQAQAGGPASVPGASTSAAPAAPGGPGVPQGPAAARLAAAVGAATSRAVEAEVSQLATEAGRLLRRRAKWFDPRHAALVVSRTAALRHTDGRLLHDLTGRVLARLPEAYSRDLLVLLRGLHHHQRLSAAAAPAAGAARPAAPPAPPPTPNEGKWQSPPRRLAPYEGPPPALLAGVRQVLAARVPTGRMPPENLDGLLRFLRALSRPAGPPGAGGEGVLGPLCAVAQEDLRRRITIFAPEPLAGVLSTLSAERHPLPPRLLAAAARQFTRHAAEYGTGAAAARFLAAAAAQLRLQQQQRRQPQPPGKPQEGGAAAAAGAGSEAAPGGASPSGGVVVPPNGGAAWVSRHLELLAACLDLMARDLPSAKPSQLVSWTQALANIGAPLASLSASAEGSSAAPVAAFLRAQAEAIGRCAPALPPDTAARLRRALDDLSLPHPRGL